MSAFDRALEPYLADAAADPFTGPARQELVTLFQTALTEGREELHQQHLDGAKGRHIIKSHTLLMDAVLQRLHRLLNHADGADPDKPGFALMATGGYGRAELAPFSDVDLLFLLGETESESLNKRIERALYFLWDLGLDLGHAVRSLDECMEQASREVEIRTSLLESRFLAGDQSLFKTFLDHFAGAVLENPEVFLEDKITEQRQRHERFGNSLFYLEPNIKENPGGLRDIHTFFWIAKYRYRVELVKELLPRGLITEEEYRAFNRCREFFWRVRNALHYRAGRRDDRLTFNHQVEIAKEFGYKDRPGMAAVEQFMRRYYQAAKQVSNLSQVFLQIYQEEHVTNTLDGDPVEDCFVLKGGKMTITHPTAFLEKPARLMGLFEISQRMEKSVHPDAMRLVTQNLGLVDQNFRRDAEVAALFLQLLNGHHAVAWVLRKMNICGLLGRYLPEFGRIIGQTQHDLFHVYTVDEHTILAVEELRNIKAGKLENELPISTVLMTDLRRPVILYLGVLFHDVAKGRGGQHEIKGAAIAREVCPRLGLDARDTEQVAWLVEKHLIFSRTAFQRDLNDPQTVLSFAREMGNIRNLDLLLLLTVADIRAVGPNVWNGWKANLLRRLYNVAAKVINRGLFTPEDIATLAEEQRQTALVLFSKHDVSEEDARAYMARFYNDYFLGFDAEDILEHYLALRETAGEPLTVSFRDNPETGATDVLIHTQDHPGLIERISGGLAAASASILSVNANTTKDGMALDIFIIQDAMDRPIKNEEKRQNIKRTLERILFGHTLPEEEIGIPKHKEPKADSFVVPTHIEWDNDYSDLYTVLEIGTKNRFGLLYTITHELMLQGAQISSAKCATYGERVIDVFYIKDMFGLKLGHEKLRRLRAGILESIERLEQQAHDEGGGALGGSLPHAPHAKTPQENWSD
ncbi:putative UTP-GlnB uridylyltransferase, GlnD [Magnetofaba australis IT-1]|uniref:Bifunctional uridylyltransferase/uridylyl-removing enzyme n=1 Tax=Magnetofaba australis IT-1 TaxID=1434232 RepID=A0A1Y2K2L6_9PROT|nr:putative UTP-GlnB uridylyltransferase, GlnD [Magnetofaba australis IT-1]